MNVTAVRAIECGHVLALTHDEQLAERMTETYNVLVGMGDTRFELVEMDEEAACVAYLEGLHGCRKCAISIPGVTI